MNDLLASLILAVIQGFSEWFPISSSGHLVLFSGLLGRPSSVAFDVALHFGTLMAVFVYFGKDIVDIVEAILKGKWRSSEARMGFLLIVATIPAALVGYLFNHFIESTFQSLLIVGIGFGITSMTLFIASIDRSNGKKDISYWDSFLIGLGQMVAILPGISRSGSTISVGLMRGLDEKTAVRFSFLISIPVIFGAGILSLGENKLTPDLLWATLVAGVVGLLTIHLLLKMLSSSRKNLRWFAIYTLALAIIVLSLIGFGILR